jgi:putative serine protease PepD
MTDSPNDSTGHTPEQPAYTPPPEGQADGAARPAEGATSAGEQAAPEQAAPASPAPQAAEPQQPAVHQPVEPYQPTAEQPTVPQPTVQQPAPHPSGVQQPAAQHPEQQGHVAQQPPLYQPPVAPVQPAVQQPPVVPAYHAAQQSAPNVPSYPPYGTQPGYPAQPAGYGQQPAHSYTQPTQPYVQPTASYAQTGQTPATATATKDKDGTSGTKRRNPGLIIAAIAVAALIGGAGGAGVMGLYEAGQNGKATPAASTGAANITVNNAKDATVVTAVAAKATPSVVTINVQDSSGQEGGTGSGIILTSDGYVLTNTHVVTLDGEIATPTIQVQDNDGKLYSAKVIGMDPAVDLAVIKLNNASGLSPATFADSSKLNVGDEAIAIGAPLGLSGTVTDGIVSALNRSIQIASSAAPKQDQQQQNGDGGDSPFNFGSPNDNGGGGSQDQQQSQGTISLPVIQTDAAINPGNSGGALLNNKGEVIGVNVAIASAGQSSDGSQSGSIGVGFAIPSNLAQRIANELKTDGKASNGLLGATVKDATSGDTVGAQIASVTGGGAADKAGLKAGDVVTNFNGAPITNATDLTAQVRALAGGATAKMTYTRDGKSYTVSVTLGTLSQ